MRLLDCLLFALGLLFLAGVVWFAGFTAVASLLVHARWEWFVASVALYFVSALFFVERSRALLAHGGRAPSFAALAPSLGASMLVNFFTPARSGDLAAKPLLYARLGVPKARGLALAALEKFVDLFFFFVFSVVAAAFFYSGLLAYSVAALACLALAFFLLMHLGKTRFARFPLLRDALNSLVEFKRLEAGACCRVVWLSFLPWLSSLASFAAAMVAVSGPVDLRVLSAFVLSSTIGVLSAIPGGLGATEASFALLLGEWGFAPVLFAGMLLFRFAGMLACALLAAPLFTRKRR
ncbi:MAG: lysylphosphatidylglycerol synthase transmembrane domain-containing protein [Candidatus Micrarchaeia archaeon]